METFIYEYVNYSMGIQYKFRHIFCTFVYHIVYRIQGPFFFLSYIIRSLLLHTVLAQGFTFFFFHLSLPIIIKQQRFTEQFSTLDYNIPIPIHNVRICFLAFICWFLQKYYIECMMLLRKIHQSQIKMFQVSDLGQDYDVQQLDNYFFLLTSDHYIIIES